MKSVLVVLSHPNLSESKINSQLVTQVSDRANVKVHDLYQHYPDGVIDIEKEQALISRYDVVVFQHPFYWYSAPALLKEWFDLVLKFNWAYGPKGEALKGKIWLSIISTGGSQQAYSKDGHHNFEIRDFLTPYEQTANLCQMPFSPPFIIHNAVSIGNDKVQIEEYQNKYTHVFDTISRDDFSIDTIKHHKTFNQSWEQ